MNKYEFVDLGIVSAKLPQNTHLWTETSAGILYLVDSTDNTALFKSIDKGDNWTQVDCDPEDIYGGANDKERPKKIARSWYDRTNGYIYFVDCSYDRTTSYVWYIDISDDSIVEVDSAPDNVYDVFMIGTDVYMVYFSSSYGIETAIIRPDGDGATTDWDTPAGPPHWNRIEEVVTQPTVGDGTVNTDTEAIDNLNSDIFTMNDGGIVLGDWDSGIITQIKIWIYGKTGLATSYITVKGNQTGTTSTKSLFFGTSYEWLSATYSGLSLNQAALNGFELTVNAAHDEPAESSTLYCDTAYIEVTFEGNDSADLYIKNITQSTTVSQGMGSPVDRSYDMGQIVIVDDDDAYFTWKWSDENVELWKYDKTGGTITEVEDFGANSNLPPEQQWALAFDNDDIISLVIGEGEEEESTIIADIANNIDNNDVVTFNGIDENGDVIAHHLWFNKDTNGVDPTTTANGIEVGITTGETAQEVSDLIQAAINTTRYFAAANVAGTSTTTTLQNVYNGSVVDIADVNSGLAVAVTDQGVDNTYYYYTYSIDGDSKTKLNEHNIALMFNRNNAASSPNENEKAFGIDNEIIYEVTAARGSLFQLDDASDKTDKDWIAITDNFGMNLDGDMFELQDVSATEISSCNIDYKIGNTTICDFISTDNLGNLSSIKFYDNSDVLLFFGNIIEKQYSDENSYFYRAIGYDNEINTLKGDLDETAGNRDAKVIIEEVLDSANWLYYSSTSITSPAIDIKADFHNISFKDLMDEIADRCDFVWYVAPDGMVYFNNGQTDSGKTVLHTSGILSDPRIKVISAQINRVKLYGGYVDGVRITATSEDTAAQQLYGVIEYIDHFPHVTDATELLALAVEIRGRDGMANSPYYVDVELYEQEFIQAGNTVNFAFSPLSFSADDLIVLSYHYDAKNDKGKYKLSTGIIQNVWRGYGSVDVKTKKGDEEQLDIVANSGVSASGAWNLKTSGDTDDYIRFSTTGNTPKMESIGSPLTIKGANALTLDGSSIRMMVASTNRYYWDNTGYWAFDENARVLGHDTKPWSTVYYHTLTDKTCATFMDRSVENLVEILIWGSHDKIFHFSPGTKKTFPHIDMGSVHEELATLAEEDHEVKGLLDEFGEETSIFYKKGDKSGIDFGTMCYALKDLVLKQNIIINELEDRIELLEGN